MSVFEHAVLGAGAERVAACIALELAGRRGAVLVLGDGAGPEIGLPATAAAPFSFVAAAIFWAVSSRSNAFAGDCGSGFDFGSRLVGVELAIGALLGADIGYGRLYTGKQCIMPNVCSCSIARHGSPR